MLSKKNYGSYGTTDELPQTSSNSNQMGFTTYQMSSGFGSDTSLDTRDQSSRLSNLFGKLKKKSSSYENVDEVSSRMGSLSNNNYYNVAKKHHDETGYVWKAIQDMINYLMSFVSEQPNKGDGFEQAEIYLEPEKKKKFEQFKAFVQTRYSSESEDHEQLLMNLWDLCMGDMALESRVTEQWKSLGFQGKDPQTDFRAAGIFGLMNLLYFAEIYPKKFKKMLRRTQEEKNAYPFAIAGINVTMLLLEIIGVHKRNNTENLHARKSFIDLLFDQKIPFRTVEDDIQNIQANSKKSQKEAVLLSFDDDQGNDFVDFGESKKSKKSSKRRRLHKKFNVTFEEIYVTTFILLDSYWWQTSAHYFQFPDILKMTKKKIETLLEDEFTDIKDIRQYNKRIMSQKKRR